MKRTVYLIQSANGFLKDIEQYTVNPNIAVQFTSFDTACDKLKAIKDLLHQRCWIHEELMPFPRLRSPLDF